jgi:hypothetical protein
MNKLQLTLQVLVVQTENLERQNKFVQQARFAIANMVSGLFNIMTNLDPNSPTSQQLTAAISQMEARDKQLELQVRRLQTEQKAVSEEKERVSQSMGGYFGRIFSTEKSHNDENELAVQEQQHSLGEKQLPEQEQQHNLDEKHLPEREQQHNLGEKQLPEQEQQHNLDEKELAE